jgi:hypothetical protein
MTADPTEHPKIIVDDDWKTKVQAEKEALKQQKESKAAPHPSPEKAEEPPEKSRPPIPEKLPPASFSMLITTLAAQAMAALGQSPEAEQGEPFVHLGLAKHYIDTLGVLEEKTKGNLTQQEAAMLDGMLHELRMMYVATSKRRPPEASKPTGE